MTRTTPPFRFDAPEVEGAPALIAELPAGIQTKESLLAELRHRLRFPDYFGENWDSLWECIRDLSWLPPGTVVLKHHDLPMTGDIGYQKTYLSILRDAVEQRWAVPEQRLRDLVVAFPPDSQERIAWLLRLADRAEPE